MTDLVQMMPSIATLVAYDYTSLATPETEALITHFLQKGKTSDHASFTHVSGIPGAGKTTYIDAHEKPAMVRIQFDLIMNHLHGYEERVKLAGAAAAFAYYEMPARVIGYELLRRAITSHMDIIFEHSLNPVHLDLYDFLHQNGYQTHLIFIQCSIDVALARVQERELIIGRHTPADFITQRFALAQKYLPVFEQKAQRTTCL